MTAAEVLAEVAAAGITLTVSGEKLIAKPSALVTREIVDALREHKGKILELLLAQREDRITTSAEVFELAREMFPNREDLPIPPSPPGSDPRVKRDTDKVEFFKGHWRKTWPRDFRSTT
jgi:hypothetical protein